MKEPKKSIKVVKLDKPAIIKELFERIIKGESVRTICKDSHMPNESTIYDWLNVDSDFAKNYARAKEIQMDRMAEEIMEIADDASRDREAFVGVNHIQRARLQIDTRKFLMSKLAPKKYGDKLDLNLGGSVEVKKVEVEIISKSVNP